MDPDELMASMKAEFVSARIDRWEFTHGPLPEESRECMSAMLYAALNADFSELLKQQDESPEDFLSNPSRCFCERD